MVLDRKSEPVTAWSLVRPTSHRVDTHTHAHTICKTSIADTIVLFLFIFFLKKQRLIARNVAQGRLKLWWPESECASVFVSKKWWTSKTENRSWKEHHGECLRRFLERKMRLQERASTSAHDLLYPPILKLQYILLKKSHYGSSDSAAMSRMHGKK